MDESLCTWIIAEVPQQRQGDRYPGVPANLSHFAQRAVLVVALPQPDPRQQHTGSAAAEAEHERLVESLLHHNDNTFQGGGGGPPQREYLMTAAQRTMKLGAWPPSVSKATPAAKWILQGHYLCARRLSALAGDGSAGAHGGGELNGDRQGRPVATHCSASLLEDTFAVTAAIAALDGCSVCVMSHSFDVSLHSFPHHQHSYICIKTTLPHTI